MKSLKDVIIGPHLTEKSVRLAEQNKYVFFVHPNANRIEIAQAIEDIYNAGKKKEKDRIKVLRVNVINVAGKRRRVGWRLKGRRPDVRKAVVTLAPGQSLEGFGV